MLLTRTIENINITELFLVNEFLAPEGRVLQNHNADVLCYQKGCKNNDTSFISKNVAKLRPCCIFRSNTTKKDKTKKILHNACSQWIWNFDNLFTWQMDKEIFPYLTCCGCIGQKGVKEKSNHRCKVLCTDSQQFSSTTTHRCQLSWKAGFCCVLCKQQQSNNIFHFVQRKCFFVFQSSCCCQYRLFSLCLGLLPWSTYTLAKT